MAKWPWIDRKFSFDYPASKFPDLLERWRGTPARLEERVAGLSRDVLTRRPGDGWSIQENVGHLLDLEYLPAERIEQILNGEAELIAADMTNRKTHEASHNDAKIEDLLSAFRAARLETVRRLESLEEADWARSALHPRLKQPMRIVDIIYFDSEHDDYHLGRIGELVRALT
ncbi:MAG: DinB family protein [Planctomycetes bacterium]|nr:DinB family protein [Planctomycetota bacterium]